MEALYLWTWPQNYSEECIGSYQYQSGEEWLIFGRGKCLLAGEVNFIPTIVFEVSKEKLEKYDCLPCGGMGFLVNREVRKLLLSLASDDVQFFPAKVICKGEELKDYYILNITHLMRGINHDESIYSLLGL